MVILLYDGLKLWVIRKQVSRRKCGRTQRGGKRKKKEKQKEEREAEPLAGEQGGSIFLTLFHSKNRKMKGKEPTMEPKGGSTSK